MKNKSIVYQFGDALYVNLTNRCPCNCDFCIRQNGDTVGDSTDLWLLKEPAANEIIAEFKKYDLKDFSEVVYCGYGEPTEALNVLLETAKYLASQGIKTRLNTNGLSDLINGKPTAELLAGVFDTVSISLNAGTEKRYNEICRPSFGASSFNAILRFARDCKNYVPNVVFTVVDVIGEDEVSKCREIADETGAPLRVRKYIE